MCCIVFALRYIVLYRIVLYLIVLHCIALYQCMVLHYIVLYCVVLCCVVLCYAKMSLSSVEDEHEGRQVCGFLLVSTLISDQLPFVKVAIKNSYK